MFSDGRLDTRERAKKNKRRANESNLSIKSSISSVSIVCLLFVEFPVFFLATKPSSNTITIYANCQWHAHRVVASLVRWQANFDSDAGLCLDCPIRLPIPPSVMVGRS